MTRGPHRIVPTLSTLLLAVSMAPAACPEFPLPYFAFAFDGGERIVSWSGPPAGSYYATFGLKALSLPGHLLMESGGVLRLSRDGGCTWEELETLGPFDWPLWIEPTSDGGAYAFTLNGASLFRIREREGTFPVESLRAPVTDVLGVGVDPADPEHVRLAGGDGRIHRSFDGGATWKAIGVAPPAGPLTYRIAFDPSDPDHAVFGAATDGGWVTFDGGSSWQPVTGLSASGGAANLFNVVVSPADGDVVWAMALDVDQSTQGHPSQGRHLYLSTDGGASFLPVVDDSAEVTLTNGPELTPHPTRALRIAWVFGSTFTGLDVYQYDAGFDQIEHEHRDGLRARTATYHPLNPNHLYLGLEGP